MEQTEYLLSRGVDTIYPTRKELEKKLASGKKISLYLGVDPTGAQLHIGHTVALRKLAQFQRAGHKVVLLIGDFTGRIGDPTGKDKTRKPLTAEQAIMNAKSYQEQASKILDFNNKKNPVEIKYNSEWLAKLTFEQIIKLAAHFTAQQMLERDMFEKRMKAGKPISLHEFFYPLMQGYDSVALDVDLEIGGTDQTFNMLAGRTLQRVINKKEKFVLTVPILADSNGVKIGKTAGNVIAITAEPADLYGKIMSLGDDVIVQAFELCTDVEMEEINQIEKNLKKGENPRDAKMRLAREIVTIYHNSDIAQVAEDDFKNVFTKHGKPTDIPEEKLPDSTDIIEILITYKLAESKSAAKRLVEQGAVKLNDKAISSWKEIVKIKSGDVLQVGKRKFLQFK
ncbi:MAG: tyrosine--tRNA ligase [bacterium]|nr:tyrosine--tRNA ligase [bacterium]